MGKLSNDIPEAFNNFKYKDTTLNSFIKIVNIAFKSVDFYEKVKFTTSDINGIKLPDEDVSFNVWLENNSIPESTWDWQYKNKVKEWEKRFFKTKSSLNEIYSEWGNRNNETIKCVEEIKPLFSDLYEDKNYLEILMKKQLESSVSSDAIQTAFDAINNGTTLKHLLLEKNHGYSKAYAKITKGL